MTLTIDRGGRNTEGAAHLRCVTAQLIVGSKPYKVIHAWQHSLSAMASPLVSLPCIQRVKRSSDMFL